MKASDVKTVDISTLKWFDRINGNTYFAQEITVNYRMVDEMTVINPFQYGYDSYKFEAFKCLGKSIIDLPKYPHMTDIIVRLTSRYALQRELKNLGK